MLELEGRAALSEFRLTKLLARLQRVEPRVSGVHAQFVHFIDTTATLSADEAGLLARLLTYGPAAQPPTSGGGAATEVVLIVPRAGTISPWSSKATDIAQVCGLTAVRRIERGIRYELDLTQPLERDAAKHLSALLFDRMTEMAVARARDAEQA